MGWGVYICKLDAKETKNKICEMRVYVFGQKVSCSTREGDVHKIDSKNHKRIGCTALAEAC